MKTFLVSLVVVGALVGTCLLWGLGVYNSFVRGEQVVVTSWASVESQYQRRFDLIPGLVNSTKGVLKQEQAVFGAIAEARTHYAGASSGSNEKVAATGELEGALARLMVIIENYPQLKSDQTVRGLMDELAGTENRIQVSRDRYNEQVRVWNTSVKLFPKSILAGLFGFEARTFFESETGAEKGVEVKLDL